MSVNPLSANGDALLKLPHGWSGGTNRVTTRQSEGGTYIRLSELSKKCDAFALSDIIRR